MFILDVFLQITGMGESSFAVFAVICFDVFPVDFDVFGEDLAIGEFLEAYVTLVDDAGFSSVVDVLFHVT